MEKAALPGGSREDLVFRRNPRCYFRTPDRNLYRHERQRLGACGAALHWARPMIPSVALATSANDAPSTQCRRLDCDDGSIRIWGVLSPDERADVELTHFDTGRVVDGWVIWVSREAGDDA